MSEKKDNVEVNESKNWDEALEKEAWIAPLVDICETADDYQLIANMPGVSKENIKIKIEEEHLLIMGRIDYETSISRKYVLQEYESGNFYRRIKISENVDESKINAQFENGQLIVNLPKHEKVKPKNINIK